MPTPAYNAIKDVGDSLVELLWEKISDEPHIKGNILQGKNDIKVGSISDLDGKKGLILFLYRVEPTPEMRNRLPERDKDNHSYNLITPPLPLNLHYLVIPCTTTIEKDHVLLGKVMQIFYDNSVLDDAHRQGSLKDSGQDLRIVPEAMDPEEMNKLWTVFKEKDFKLSVSYIVTPVEIESIRKRKVHRVEEPVVGVHEMER